MVARYEEEQMVEILLTTRQKVLFVSVAEGTLALLAEAYLRHLKPNSKRFEVYSAVINTPLDWEVHPVVRTMVEELGQGSRRLAVSKVSDCYDEEFDYVILVGDEAAKAFHVGKLRLPATGRVLIWDFPNPTRLSSYMQYYGFQQVGRSLCELIRGLISLPRFGQTLPLSLSVERFQASSFQMS